jgi:hypothetical protein
MKTTNAAMWRRLQSAGSRLISTRRAEMSLGAAGRSACATIRIAAIFAVAAFAAGDTPGIPVQFTDVAAQAGIHFVHNAGRSGKKYLPETTGAGCAFFDFDGDGWPDILLVNGRDFTPGGRHTTAALYHNNHNGTFTDVTKGSGLDVEMYGMGVAIGDYDNDGRDDVYITALEGDRLFHNEGNGKFRDVTRESWNPKCQFRHQRGMAGLRPRRQARSVCRQLCAVEREGRQVLLAGWQDEVVLHAGRL